MIKKALIIRRDGVELSKKYAQVTADSCSQYNLDYEFIKAVEFLPADKAIQSVGMQYKYRAKHSSQACCTASHILAFKRIVELNETCLVLEHDALLLGDVRQVEIPNNVVVTFGFRVGDPKDYVPPEAPKGILPIENSTGTHAYAITPVTAKTLLNKLETKGVTCDIDQFLMIGKNYNLSAKTPPLSGLPLYVCDPPQAVCWVRQSTMAYKTNGQTKEGRVGIETVRNKPHNMELESWKRGLQK